MAHDPYPMTMGCATLNPPMFRVGLIPSIKYFVLISLQVGTALTPLTGFSSIRKVHAGEEGGPGGLPNLLKEEEKQEDDDEKKEDDEEEEKIKGKRKDEDEMQDSLMVEECMMVNFPLVPCSLGNTTCLLPLHHLLQCSFQEEEVKQPHCRDAKIRTSLSGTALCTCHHHTPARPVENPLVEETASLNTRSLTTCRPALVVGPVQPLWKKTYQESLA